MPVTRSMANKTSADSAGGTGSVPRVRKHAGRGRSATAQGGVTLGTGTKKATSSSVVPSINQRVLSPNRQNVEVESSDDQKSSKSQKVGRGKKKNRVKKHGPLDNETSQLPIPPPPPPPLPSSTKGKKDVKKEEVIYKAMEAVAITESEAENQSSQSSGRSMRPRGADKKAITTQKTKPYFHPSELSGIVPYALASQCRMVTGRLQTTLQQFHEAGERFDRKGDELLANFGNSLRKIRQRKKDKIVDAAKVEPEPEKLANKLSNKITFDFMAAAELEEVPVQPSKKIILDSRISAIAATEKVFEDENQIVDIAVTENVEEDEDKFVDIFETSDIVYDDEVKDREEKPVKSVSVGKCYTPDITYLTNPNDTFVTEDKNRLSKERRTLNKTVSLPGSTHGNYVPLFQDSRSSHHLYDEEALEENPIKPATVGKCYTPDITYLTDPNETFIKEDKNHLSKKLGAFNETVSLPGPAYGNHVPLFQDFSNSRHQLSTLDILPEEEDDQEDSPAELLPKFMVPDAMEEKKRKEASSSSSSSSSSYKSAVSQLQPKKVVPILVNAKKLDQLKKKAEDAQRNKDENLKKKQDMQKKKNEEWKQKADKIKQEQEKQSSVKKTAPSSTMSVILNKAVLSKPPRAVHVGPPPAPQNLVIPGVNRLMENFTGFKPSGPMKGYIKQGAFSKAMPLIPPPLAYTSINTPVKSMVRSSGDDVFKTPGNMSFLDATYDSGGPASSYDITLYEDLDDDLKHRENKYVPDWATNKTEIAMQLFKQLGSGTVKGVGFPFPTVKKGYRLFSDRVQ